MRCGNFVIRQLFTMEKRVPVHDIRTRLFVDFHRFSRDKFSRLWEHPAVCSIDPSGSLIVVV